MKRVELRITNARLLLGDNLVEAGVAIENGKIVKVAKEPNLPDSDTGIDAKGTLMIPGVVDAHVHMRDLNLSYKEDFSSGTQAAVIGGVTTVLDMPNTSPPTNNAERLKEKISKAATMIFSNMGFFGTLALEPYETTKMINEGAVGLKLYLNDPQYSSLSDKLLVRRLLEPVKSCNSVLAIHAEFPEESMKQSKPTGMKDEIDHFLRAHDPRLEIRAVSKCIEIAKELGIQVHLCHVSTEAAITMVIKEKCNTNTLTAEVTPHHLLLSEELLYRFGPYAKMAPPLRMPSDAQGLFQGLISGNVDMIASDHAPHSIEEKSRGFTDAPSGIPGLETMLPLILTEMTRGRISLKTIIQTMSQTPSSVFKLNGVGRIAEGYNADIVLVDLKRERRIEPNDFFSKAKYSPFRGRKVKGIPVLTLVNGIPVMRDGEIIGKPGDGRIIKRRAQTGSG